jgi:hypothetical protein
MASPQGVRGEVGTCPPSWTVRGDGEGPVEETGQKILSGLLGRHMQN